MPLILIGGGARSGKSSYALTLARASGGRAPRPAADPPIGLFFLATATPTDPDIAARIDRHKSDRGPDFQTIEEPVEIAQKIPSSGTVVVDCLTLWLSNLSQPIETQPKPQPISSKQPPPHKPR